MRLSMPGKLALQSNARHATRSKVTTATHLQPPPTVHPHPPWPTAKHLVYVYYHDTQTASSRTKHASKRSTIALAPDGSLKVCCDCTHWMALCHDAR